MLYFFMPSNNPMFNIIIFPINLLILITLSISLCRIIIEIFVYFDLINLIKLYLSFDLLTTNLIGLFVFLIIIRYCIISTLK